METTKEKQASELNIWAFWKAQKPDWRTTVIRTSLERLGYKMILPYLSLFIILLGATKTQLGLVTSAGMLVAGLLGPIIGQQIDRHGPKRVYILGILVLIGGYLAFAGAKTWQIGVLGMFLHQMGATLSGQSCANICGNCLANCDRAKGMLVCESLAAGVLGMVGPMLSGWFLVNIMGVIGTPTKAEQIRPLFYIVLAICIVSLFVVIFCLKLKDWNYNRASTNAKKRNVIQDATAIFRADKNCIKWVFISAVGRMPMALVIPYMQLYAAEVKGANAMTLSGMVTATAFTSVICGYALGILSDKYGRKKILGASIGLYIIGLVIMLVSKNPSALILVGILAGFQELSMTLAGSMQHELVPAWVRGRWSGVLSLTGSFVSAGMAALSGIIYDKIGAQWVFIIYIVFELIIRVPLLFSMPETLTYKVDDEKFSKEFGM